MCIYCSFRSAEVPFGDLELSRRDIYSTMGSSGYVPDEEMKRQVEDTIGHITSFCRPRYGYSILEASEVKEEAISIAGKTLHPGRAIMEMLRGADRYAIMVATAGMEFEQWYDGERHSGDILREFLASNIGSEIAEATSRIGLEEIGREFATTGWGVGNPYAPGYCGWHVSDQQALFSLLPPLPCGIRLNPSSLMIPIKSISGIIPIGAKVTKKAYGCAICDYPDCYRRNQNQ